MPGKNLPGQPLAVFAVPVGKGEGFHLLHPGPEGGRRKAFLDERSYPCRGFLGVHCDRAEKVLLEIDVGTRVLQELVPVKLVEEDGPVQEKEIPADAGIVSDQKCTA